MICISAKAIQAQDDGAWGLGLNFGLNAHKAFTLDYGVTVFAPKHFQLEASYSAHEYSTSDIAVLRKRLDEYKSVKYQGFTIGLNRPIRKSSWVWTLKFAGSFFRSDASVKWYDYKDRPYQKRISTHHDINVYNLIGGIAWRPELSKNRWYLDISFLPSLQWYGTPSHRNTEEDSIWAARQDFMRNPDQAQSLSWHFRVACVYRIF